jgi:hypothetical protein
MRGQFKTEKRRPPAKESRRLITKESFNMTSLNQGSAPVNPAAEREYLLHALRTAATRSRLVTNLLDTIGVSLRHKQVSVDEAMKWLADEGLLDHVQLGPPGSAS